MTMVFDSAFRSSIGKFQVSTRFSAYHSYQHQIFSCAFCSYSLFRHVFNILQCQGRGFHRQPAFRLLRRARWCYGRRRVIRVPTRMETRSHLCVEHSAPEGFLNRTLTFLDAGNLQAADFEFKMVSIHEQKRCSTVLRYWVSHP